MLDLKAKLAAAGLVTPAEVAAAEVAAAKHAAAKQRPGRSDNNRGPARDNRDGNRDSNRDNRDNRDNRGPARDNRGPARTAERGGPRAPHAGKPAAPRSGLDVPALEKAGKGAAYDAIRRVIERARLDPVHAIPGEQAEAFHFTTGAGQLSRLMLEPGARAQLGEGSAGIVAFMSHHGLAHCVVPRVLAEDIARLFPFWLRVLKDHPGAGQQEPPRPPREPAPQVSSDPEPAPQASSDPEPEPDPAPAA